MSWIEFHSPVGAPGKYDLLYVSVVDDDTVRPELNMPAAIAETEALAAKGSPIAQFLLGHILLSGQGMARDAEAAYRWFAASAQAGRADAINMVGRCHECGWGVAVDRGEAARWYALGVEKGDGWSMYNLGTLTMAGEGAERDERGALALFVRAARHGNVKAMTMLGQCREDGVATRRKPASAGRWYRRAAERGCFRAQYNLARFLARAGQYDAAAQWLRSSFATAPPEFCRDGGRELVSHPHPVLQSAGREALARASETT